MGVMASPPKGLAPKDFLRGTLSKDEASSEIGGSSVVMDVIGLRPPPKEVRLALSVDEADGRRIRVTDDCSPVVESRADITMVSPADAEGRRDVAGVKTFPVAGVEGPT